MAVLSVRARALLRRRLLQLLAAGSGLLLLAAIRWLRAVKARAAEGASSGAARVGPGAKRAAMRRRLRS